jgi:hypothetical protein
MFSFLPFNSELTLIHAVFNYFTATFLNSIVGNAGSNGIVSDQGCWCLQMSNFIWCALEGTGLFAVIKSSAKYGFGCRQEDFGHHMTEQSTWMAPLMGTGMVDLEHEER